MSQEMELSSPHSSHHSQQDYPPLPSQTTRPTSTWSKKSWTWGKKGDTPSTTVRRTTDPIPPPTPSTLSGSRITTSSDLVTGSPDTHLGPLPTVTSPKPRTQTPQHALSPPPQLSYDELRREVERLRSDASKTSNKPSTGSTTEQVVQDWRQKQAPSTGHGSEPHKRKPTPSMRSRQSTTSAAPFGSSQSGLSSIGSTKHAESARDSLESLLILGWSSEPAPDPEVMTPEQRASEYTNIWSSRHTDRSELEAFRSRASLEASGSNREGGYY
ncbi:hypothetical protein ARMSODRAFT_983622 [Armillaria solidipes]|uniref:Uncharacterized protein n=1 Tax=Armillaria solidipes TaxID=1076256 RepID=A0A2H3B4C6_9AGAR|nr:hypothetical protein ARMSODRAFT_983622 [Armillaria solidipes]